MATAPENQEAIERLWDAAASCAAAQNREEAAEFRQQVADAVRNLLGKGADFRVYVTQTNATGYRNQVWQGEGKSQPNDVIVLVDTSGNREGVSAEARSRLNPLSQSGFDAVVICKPGQSADDWEIAAVIEYDHSVVGEKIREKLGPELELRRVPDPSIDAPVPSFPAQTAESQLLDAQQVIRHLQEAKNVVLAGPPGTGKTYVALDVIRVMSSPDSVEDGRLENVLQGRRLEDVPTTEIQAPALVWDMVQLHPSYGYEEFVRGLRTDPNEKGFSLVSVDGPLTTIARVAARRGEKPTLLVVDEINRANIAAVFGETIFAIDPGQRGRSVRLQYDGSGSSPNNLSVPPNLFLLATMNTADRSIAMVDFALRRRFRFVRVPPSGAALTDFYSAQPARGQAARQILDSLNNALTDRDIQIGHSYFILKDVGDDTEWSVALAERIHHEVRPLLKEYVEEGRLNPTAVSSVSTAGIDLLQDLPDDIQAKVALLLGTTGGSDDQG